MTEPRLAGRCESTHCVTCSDEAVEMRVLATDGAGLARCAAGDGSESDVMTELVGEVAAGDALLVHAGTAIGRAG